MRVVLQIVSGPQAGRKAVLGPDRELQVGRSEWAEVACDDDAKMSRVHFKLSTNAYGCSVEDLGSSNGTYVNDERIEGPVVLREGDALRAGDTHFEVRVEGGSQTEAETINQQQAAARRDLQAVRGTSREAAQQKQKKIPYRAQATTSGLSLFTPARPPEKQAAEEAAQLAERLRGVAGLYLLVHATKVPGLSSEELPLGEPLFDWLPEEIARQRGPLLLAGEACQELAGLYEKAWGHNALVTFVATAALADLLAQLRRVVRPSENADGVVGVCWPNVLAGLLTEGDGQLFETQLPDVQAVLLEDPARGNSWKLIAEAGFADVLDGLGMIEAEAAS